MTAHTVVDRRGQLLLRLDAGAAAVVGFVELALRGPLARLLGFSASMLLVIALANLVYAAHSGTLAIRAWRGVPPSRSAITTLVGANLCWAGVCATLVVTCWARARVFGLGMLVTEGVFVAGLAIAEHRWIRPQTGSGRSRG